MRLFSKLPYEEKLLEVYQYAWKWLAHAVREFLASGDKLQNLPDTNYKLGLNHLRKGNLSDAAFRFWIVTRFVPEHAEAYYNWGRCLILQEKNDMAREKLEKALRIKASFPEATFALTKLIAPEKVAEIPAALIVEKAQPVTDNFGEVIEYPDSVSIQEQRRNIRRRLLKQILLNIKDKNPNLSVLDLECGDGFCGEFLKQKEVTKRITGVDPSPLKTGKARARKVGNEAVYDTVSCEEIRDFLGRNNEKFDLVLVTRAISYFGDVSGVATLVRRVLNPSGMVAFVTQDASHADYLLDVRSDSFSHSVSYIKKQFEKQGFEKSDMQEIELLEGVKGTIFIYILGKEKAEK